MTLSEKRCLSLHMGYDDRMLDHIAPLSYMLNIPLLITEEKNFLLAKELYPMVETIYQDYTDLSYEEIARSFDVLFQCTFWSAHLVKYFAKLCDKDIRLVYCPHGNSDKGHMDHTVLEDITKQDRVLIYGEHMKDLLKKQGHWNNIPPHAFTGNYRLAFYQMHREFYLKKVEEQIFSHLPKNPITLLYAPTWNDCENLSSFFDRVDELVRFLPENYNLLIKLHPLLQERDPAQFFAALPEAPSERVFFIEDFPCIYPILEKISAYIGDFSSIGYDALFFEKPMFFFDSPNNEKPSSTKNLHKIGVTLSKRKKELYEEIALHLKWNEGKKEEQKKLFQFAFGHPIDRKVLQETVGKIL